MKKDQNLTFSQFICYRKLGILQFPNWRLGCNELALNSPFKVNQDAAGDAKSMEAFGTTLAKGNFKLGRKGQGAMLEIQG